MYILKAWICVKECISPPCFDFTWRYVIERVTVEDPSMHVSHEDLGGRPQDADDPQIKEVVHQLLKIADDLNKNAEIQKYVFHFISAYSSFYEYEVLWWERTSRAVTVADLYHRGGNGLTTAGGAVLCIFIYIILKCKNKWTRLIIY